MADRPELRIVAKAKDGGLYTNLFAFWRNERGMLNGKIDNKIKKIAVQMTDGEIVYLEPTSHFINAMEGSKPASAATPKKPAKPPEDDSDIPF